MFILSSEASDTDVRGRELEQKQHWWNIIEFNTDGDLITEVKVTQV